MKIFKRTKWIIYLMLPVMMAMSCNSNSGKVNLSETGSDSVSKPETVIDIISYTNNAEIDLGQLASRNGDHSMVKKYAEMMVDQHKKAQEDLDSIAEERKVSLPESVDLNDRDQQIRDSLNFLSGETFDSLYIQSQIKMHSATIDLFEAISDTTKDPNLKNFVDEYLPKVKMHRMKADSIANMLNTGTDV